MGGSQEVIRLSKHGEGKLRMKVTFEQWLAAYVKAKLELKTAYVRYNITVSGEKYGDLYGDDSEGNKTLLTYPIRFGSIVYFVTEEYPTVYKYNESTGKYRENKTAYKDCLRKERAIDKAQHKLKILRDAGWCYCRCYGWNAEARDFLKTA